LFQKSFEKLKVAASKKPAEKAKQSEKIKVLEKEMLEEDKKLKEVRCVSISVESTQLTEYYLLLSTEFQVKAGGESHLV